MRDKNLSVECSVLESAPKQSGIEVTVRTMRKRMLRCLCRRFVRKFHNAYFYVVCLQHITVGSRAGLGHAVVIIVWRFTVGLLINVP